MSFASPYAIAWALLAVPIIIFYILKIRMRRVPVSTTLFWKQVFEEKAPRSLWQQLRHVLSLLLQLLLLMILVFALADPYLNSELRNQQRIVVVVDVSASMQSSSKSGATPFEEAIKEVSALIRSLRTRDEMALIVAGARSEVACGLTSHQRTLNERLLNIRPTDGPAEINEAISTAEMLLAGHQNARVTVVTDARIDASELAESQENVTWKVVGDDLPNVGITRFQTRRSLVDRLSYQTFVRVTNFSDEPKKCKLDLLLNDAPIDVFPLNLQPNETWTKVIAQTSTEGGILTAELRFDDEKTDRDGLATDNKAFAVVPKRDRIPVQLVTDGNWFLERVLEANDSLDVNVLRPNNANTEPPAPQGLIRIYHRRTPDVIPPGPTFVVQPENSCDLWQASGALNEPLVGEQDSEHELMKNVRLDNVLIPKARKIIPKGAPEVLAESVDGEPLYMRFKRNEGDVVVLCVDLDQGDLPLRTAFPILLINAINDFSSSRKTSTDSVAAGDIRQIPIPRQLSNESDRPSKLRLVSPSGDETLTSVSNETVLIGPLPTVGIWNLSAAQDNMGEKPASVLQIACNLEAPLEGRLQGTDAPLRSDESEVTGTSGFPVWFWLSVTALALLFAEWFLFQRRWVA